MRWLKRCKCAEGPPDWYPTRLLDLRHLKRDPLVSKKPIPGLRRDESHLDETQIAVVYPKRWEGGKPGHRNTRYVTLSHCWGPPEHHGPKLSTENMAEFEAGVKISSLPKTFRDAIRFAARLPQVGFIWIDSLCIKQGDLEDWLTESARMNQVYSKSFLNISATAASDSNGGLYFPRSPELLLEDEISLNIDGIPVPWDQAVEPVIATKPSPSERQTLSSRWARRLFGRYFQNSLWKIPLFSRLLSLIAYFIRLLSRKTAQVTSRKAQSQVVPEPVQEKPVRSDSNLRRCVILDTSFWTNRVDRAPVNRRAWVLQERLLCPRVLHFCGDQVAWECAEFDAAEARPLGVPNYQLTGEGLLQESQFKGLDPDLNGRALRSGRLRGLPDPVSHLQPQVHAFELWKRVVEVYSRTRLTDAGDKLIALSGIARLMSSRIGSEKMPAKYVAGLWRPHLESQLLWKVEPVFNPRENTFEHYGLRPKPYRAPSFSWAAIDTEQGHGITYGEVTDKEIYIRIEEAFVKPKSQDPFGMVEASRLTLWGKLRRIRLIRRDKGRFCWTLVDREELALEEHTNIYLDSVPDTPFDTDDVYCLPTAKGGYLGTGDSTYIFCLLLRLANFEGAIFERIGFTKLSLWADKETHRHILEVEPRDIDLPHTGYSEDGEHRFVLV